MKQLVVVADDFAFTDGVTDGIIEAYHNGILTEMSFMVDAPGSTRGARRAIEEGITSIGIHLTLNDLVGTGIYLRTKDYHELLVHEKAAALQERVKTELKKFEDTFGRPPTHINSHQHILQHEKLIDMVAEYAAAHSIYVRRPSDKESNADYIIDKINASGTLTTDYVFEHILGSYDEAKKGFCDDVSTVREDSVTEIFFHPGYIDATLQTYSSLLDERERDLALLLDKDFRTALSDFGMHFTSFSEIRP